MRQTMRILLADDHAMIREGIRRLLEMQTGVEIVGEVADGRTAVNMARELSPDVLVMDINMPDLNGIEATRQIRLGKTAGESPRVIGLSARADRRTASEMLRAGAMAYVLKESAFQEMVAALDAVMANKVFLSPKVAGAILDDYVQGGSSTESGPKLSPREREVLQLMAEGKATKEVAMQLQVSTKTVETHRKNLMGKLAIDNVAELTKFAIREGITSLE